MINNILSQYKKLILSGQERSVRAKKNILWSALTKVLSILITLWIVPLTIGYLNPTRYGIWLTLTSIISWISFFDIGFGNGLRNRFSEAKATGDIHKARVYLSTTYSLLIFIFGGLLVIFAILNLFINWPVILHTGNELAKELTLLAFIVFSFVCLQFVLQLILTVLIADQRPAIASFFNLLSNAIALSLIFLITKTTSGSLVLLGTVSGVAPVLVMFAISIWFYRRDYKQYTPAWKYVDFSYVRSLWNLGIKFFIIQIAFIILFQTNNIIIAQLFGPKEVTSYNIAFKYFSVASMMIAIIISPFWSATTEAYIKKDYAWIENSISKLIKIWGLLVVFVIAMLLLSNLVYSLWVGNSIQIPLSISIAMTFYVIINAWNGIFSQFLNGIGKVQLQLYSAIFGAIVNIPLAILFGKLFSIAGIIFSNCLLGIINMTWIYIQYRKIIKNQARGIWAK